METNVNNEATPEQVIEVQDEIIKTLKGTAAEQKEIIETLKATVDVRGNSIEVQREIINMLYARIENRDKQIKKLEKVLLAWQISGLAVLVVHTVIKLMELISILT